MGVQAIKHAALLRAWSGRIVECRSSGKTVKAWCEAEGVSIKTYYYWEKRIVAEASQEANLPVTTQSSRYCQELCAKTTASLMKLVRRKPDRPKAYSA